MAYASTTAAKNSVLQSSPSPSSLSSLSLEEEEEEEEETKRKKKKQRVKEKEEELIEQGDSTISSYDEISITEYETTTKGYENMYMFSGTFVVLVFVFMIIMIMYTTEGQRFYREYIKKYIDIIFTKKEYNYNV